MPRIHLKSSLTTPFVCTAEHAGAYSTGQSAIHPQLLHSRQPIKPHESQKCLAGTIHSLTLIHSHSHSSVTDSRTRSPTHPRTRCLTRSLTTPLLTSTPALDPSLA